MSYNNLKQELKAGTIRNLYLFYGEEDYLREHYLSQLRGLVLSPDFAQMNHFRFDAKVEIAALERAVEALPMFARLKLIEIHDFDFYRAAAAKRDALDEILANLPEYCVLVFVFSDANFKPDGRMKIQKHFKKQGLAVNFEKQAASDLLGWVARRFRAHEKTIDRSTADYLLFLCGTSMTKLIGETEKIAAYAKNEQITRGDIDAVAEPVLEAVVWDFTDAATKRQFDTAATIMGKLLHMREEPIFILAALGKQLRQLLSAKIALEHGKSAAYVKKLWNMKNDYAARKSMDRARTCSIAWCRAAVRLASDTDRAMKSTGQGGDVLLKDFLIQLSAAGA